METSLKKRVPSFYLRGWERIGELWFRYRSFSPLFILGIAFFFPTYPLSYSWALGFWLLVVAAEGLRLWAVGYAGSVTRTRENVASLLVHNGPFRYVRNPLYLANMVIYLSLLFLFGYRELVVIAFFYFLLQYSLIVRYEEKILETSFGKRYEVYRRQVHRWLPSWRPMIMRSNHTFSFKKALRSERTTLFLLVIAFSFWLWKQGFFF